MLDALTAWGLDHAVEPDDPDRHARHRAVAANRRNHHDRRTDVDTDTHADWGPERSRTVTWHSPGPSTAKGLTMSGVDYLRAMVDGDLPQPPIAGLMQFDFVEAEPGARRIHLRARRIRVQPDRRHSRRTDLHAAGLGDGMRGAQHASAGQGLHVGRDQGELSQGGPAVSSGLLTATGTVVKAGSRVGFAEGVVTDAGGAVVATATSTLLIFDL